MLSSSAQSFNQPSTNSGAELLKKIEGTMFEAQGLQRLPEITNTVLEGGPARHAPRSAEIVCSYLEKEHVRALSL